VHGERSVHRDSLSLLASLVAHYSPEVIRTAQFLMFFTPENMFAVILASMMKALGWFNLSNRTRYAAVAMPWYS
jgi:hypothetical protein